MYFGPIILVLSIWALNVVELKKETPNPNNLLFYKVIAGSFTLMHFFVMPIAISSTFHLIISILLGLFTIAITVVICMPIEKLPSLYAEKLQIPINTASKESVNESASEFENKEEGGPNNGESK